MIAIAFAVPEEFTEEPENLDFDQGLEEDFREGKFYLLDLVEFMFSII